MKGEHPDSHLVQTELLSGIEVFNSVDPDVKKEIAQKLSLRSFPAGQSIFFRLSPATEVFFVIEGRVRTCVFSQSGKQVHFGEVGSGKMFGLTGIYFEGQRPTDAIAVEATQVAVMNSSDFRQIVNDHSSVTEYTLSHLARVSRQMMMKVYEYSTSSVKERIRFELVRIASEFGKRENGEIVVAGPPTHAEIAARISSHREAITRELKKLEASGLITWKPGTYIIHDLASLAADDGTDGSPGPHS